MRIKICRKESKESRLFLRLLYPAASQLTEREALIAEATELINIFGAILRNSAQP